MHKSRLSIYAAGLALALLVVLFFSSPSLGQGFPPISPEELTMTSEAQAPGASAIILYREVDRDDNGMTSHEDDYVRVKILTEEGRKQANVEIPFVKGRGDIANIRARTIRPDGSAVDSDVKVFETTIEKVKGLKYFAKTFTLPDVQVGSIIEYRYTSDLPEHLIYGSPWILSQRLFTKHAKFSLKPYVSRTRPMSLRWTWQGIPPGVAPKEGPDHVIRMEADNIPALELEDYMPPTTQLQARVDFIYESEFMESDPDAYWQHVGKRWNEFLETFIGKPKAMQDAVVEIVSPSDAPEEKLRKIYSRVQQLRNLTYENRKSVQEEKREKEKPAENVEDVWKHGYGSHRDLNYLYLALARAAGFDAYGVWVSSRKEYFFQPQTMENRKLNSFVVLVKLNGKDLYFDPGAALAPFGMLTWSETGTPGLCLNKDGGTWVKTTLPQSSESMVKHIANLKLREDGSLEGKVTLTYTGLEAMYHRLDVRNTDDEGRKTFIDNRIRRQIPESAKVKLLNEPDWTNPETPLVAEFHITIPDWASAAGKRTIFSVGVFAANEKKLFERENRIQPIYISYPYQKEDDITIELPEGLEASGVPAPQNVDGHIVTYNLKVENGHTTVHITRKLTWDFLFLDQKYYGSLRNFFQTVRTNDDQQVVLEPAVKTSSN
jgi:hypothetical protein